MYWTTGSYSITVNGNPAFQDANPSAGIANGTVFDAAWANMLTNEGINLVQAAGLTPSQTDATQITQAVQKWAAKNRVVFETSGATFNGSALAGWTNGADWTVPPNVFRIRTRAVGGGGGASGSSSSQPGAGGGAGGYAEGFFDVTPGQTIQITVGSGGAGGAAAGSGLDGAPTSVGTQLTVLGGSHGGYTSGSTAGGAGGAAFGGDVQIPGGSGGDGYAVTTGVILPGYGGASAIGTSVRAASSAVGTNGASYGGGGAAIYGRAAAGGTGAPGVVIVEW